jgi:hypothetical protein
VHRIACRAAIAVDNQTALPSYHFPHTLRAYSEISIDATKLLAYPEKLGYLIAASVSVSTVSTVSSVVDGSGGAYVAADVIVDPLHRAPRIHPFI